MLSLEELGYVFDSDGLRRSDSEELLSNYILVPQAAYRCGDSEVPFACRLACQKADGSEFLLDDRKRLSAMDKNVWRQPPPGCWFSPNRPTAYRHLQFIFNELLNQVPQIEVVEAGQVGWMHLPSGHNVYVTEGEVIGASPEEQAHIWLSESLAGFRMDLPAGYTSEDALGYFRRLFELIPGITDVLLANMLASILFPLFRSAGIQTWFSVMLQGPSGAKKTTLAKMTCGLYATPQVYGLSSSSAALRRRSEQARHCTVIYDDLFPDNGPALRKKALDLLREHANQEPREVMLGGQITRSPRESGLVFTVEEFPQCRESSLTRCLRLSLKREIPNHVLAPFQTGPNLLGIFFREFIFRVSRNYEKMEGYIACKFADYRAERAKADAVRVESERMQEIGFILYTSVSVMVELFGSVRQDLPDVFRHYLTPWLTASPGVQKRDYLQVIPLLHQRCPRYFEDRHGCWCILPEELGGLIRRQFQDPGITTDLILRQLRARHALAMDKSMASTKKVHGRRYLFLLPQRLGPLGSDGP